MIIATGDVRRGRDTSLLWRGTDGSNPSPSSDESVPNFPFGTVLERRRDSSGPLDIAARSRLFGLLTQTASSGVATTLETQQDEPKVIR